MDGSMWQGVFGLVTTAMWIGLIVFVFVSLRKPLIELLLPRVTEVNAFGVGIAFDQAEELLAKAAESALAGHPAGPPLEGAGDRDPAAGGAFGAGAGSGPGGYQAGVGGYDHPAQDGPVPRARPAPPDDPDSEGPTPGPTWSARRPPAAADDEADDAADDRRPDEGSDTPPTHSGSPYPSTLPLRPPPAQPRGAADTPRPRPTADPRRGSARPSLYGQRSAAARLEHSAATLRGGRILWVDDHPENNRHLIRLFQEVGMTVIPVVSTPEAVAELSPPRCDLVISDIGRAGAPDAGLDMLREFGAQGIDIPVILYTSQVRPDSARSPLVYGATDSATDVVNYVIDLMERLRFDRIAPRRRTPRPRGWIRRG
ncbi:response regulator receiver domain-containing protein [Murinocardiopsis flavida]|uniref:Response regulator receiver domain-containing protein n=1 Tax=Murinocardiopsis flavida TaxID=645275 RepID=A0A2P8CW59_9ACTN|nr:response regulator [Murinocardiopsis flavida]PSK89187.1 response regulator receiver domain-containing protein [Murinocardiopsis flavida]